MSAKYILAVLSFFMVSIFLMGCQQVDQVITPDDSSSKLPAVLTPEQIDGLIYTRLAEKLARDVYSTLYTSSGIIEFSNITTSEQKHMDAVKRMLDKYSITDPIVLDEIGAFPVQAFQDDYVKYIAYEDPIQAGIDIEKYLIDQLEAQLVLAPILTNPDLFNFYTNLFDGSDKHLLAFTSLQ